MLVTTLVGLHLSDDDCRNKGFAATNGSQYHRHIANATHFRRQVEIIATDDVNAGRIGVHFSYSLKVL